MKSLIIEMIAVVATALCAVLWTARRRAPWLQGGLRWVCAMMLALAMMPAAGCSNKAATQDVPAKASQSRYHCPMHPQIVSDKPGECPICGMALVRAENKAESNSRRLGETPRPTGIQEIPPGRAKPQAEPTLFQQIAVDGLAQVIITPETRQRMGLTVGTVEKRMMTRTLRVPARIVADETRQTRVVTKIEGYVETLFVSATGQAVKKGDPLFTLYSPQWISAQEEFRVALQSGMASLVESARQRLRSWDIPEPQIAAIEKTDGVERTLTLQSPAGGMVTEKSLLAGQKIMPGESLMVITDCSVVWAEADIHESDLPLVRVGLPVTLSFPYWPGKSFAGAVSFLPPGLNPEMHTLKARLSVPNPDGLLKLGMYADADLVLSLGERTAIPESAVMQTGTHSYVFRDDGNGKLTPVTVRLGTRADGFYEVLSGLAAGDRVVASANFLVDSESSIRAAIEAYGTVEEFPAGGAPGPPQSNIREGAVPPAPSVQDGN